MRKITVGVIGCSLIAQVMHLPNLRDLREHFDLLALCDISPEVLSLVADDYFVERRYARHQDLIAQPDIEAVLILSSGDHAPLIMAALEAGKHVFVEKPLCFGLRDADRLIEMSSQHNLCLMVGYMKWFDPTYQEAKKLLRIGGSPQLLQITTIQTPEDYYYRHYRLHRSRPDASTIQRLQEERARQLAIELPDVPQALRDVYVDLLLDSAIHDLYVLRGLMGDPQKVVQCSFWAHRKAFHLSWHYSHDLQAHYNFMLLENPGGSYLETAEYYNPHQRLSLDFPSPYLRNAPTKLTIEEAKEGRIVRWQSQGSFEEAFKLEILHFHECILNSRTPRSSGLEGRKDIALMQAAIRASSQST